MLHSNDMQSFASQPAPVPLRGPSRLGDILVAERDITNAQLDWAVARQKRHRCRLGHVLLSHGLVGQERLYSALAHQCGTTYVSGPEARGDPGLIDRLGASFCAQTDLLPLRRAGGVTLVATSEPQCFDRHRDRVEELIGPVVMVVMGQTDLRDRLRDLRRHRLVQTAECRVPRDESCRHMNQRVGWLVAAILAALSVLALSLAPTTTFIALTILTCAVTLANTALLLTATLVSPDTRMHHPPDRTLTLARLPPVSVLVPLYKEREIAGALVERLARLKYPRELLDVCLVVEDCDRTTQRALERADLPLWMRVVSVPDGSVRTKPRAMNFALDFCRGDVVGVYDAEDAPPPDQILRVVHQFARIPAHVGCLQGRLNFYNPRASWLTRCFAIDYAAWFNLILPTLHRLGWPIPLGGTTVFFRRAALRDAGGWDAHNVTEDADLGMRLARKGYRTDLLQSVTLEEATCSARAWVNQRSRWQKGYAITWLVHMRYPLRLWRDLGGWRFVGVQMLFLGSLGGALLAPVLWSFGLLAVGLPHPLSGEWSRLAAILLTGTLVSSLVINMAIQLCALRKIQGPATLYAAIPLMHLYHALSSVALVKALYELLFRPYFWHKTAHGVTQPDETLTIPDPAPHQA